MCVMFEPCILQTPRLLLRPFELSDAPRVTALAGEKDVASGTLLIPHPYGEEMAVKWIRKHEAERQAGTCHNWGITLQDGGVLMGAIGIRLRREHDRGEIVYWIGKDYWNKGYATEATRAVIAFGFEVLGLSKVHAGHFTRNPASGRVLQKIGMRHEGQQRQHLMREGVLEDVECYGILRGEWEADCQRSTGSRR